ncbi:VIT1/CCC1 family predicted Fe2+/Mn2+ transporter [Thermocatellispora tengchongensis]|uniref:VIT1/CCC1 family predicted Fe2+/Mn2+ transporter n=1 Tax=Thermocatellispora tengchongensis TaxID=1073253 RepID=A0A840P1Z7_9ACTN|nr:VIT1/CCC1 transporter family protein [Thermocatellispora tengchongensis]MBB5131267.1 VIT1/CCC1 family predicted Fe2+/Mn2+ transporter [Thermocatellispora tengchongensis]
MTLVQEHVAEQHHHHRDVTGGWLRPAVFGVMDGLVSNAALIAGVVGGGASATTVTIAGLAGLAAGAFSMATGEYTSVVSQTEMTKAEIAVERREIDRHPEAEKEELALLYQSRGLSPDLSRQVAEELHKNGEIAWRVHAREELGVDPDDLPSPWVAAGSSFLAFALGALIPLLPFLFGFGSITAAVVLTALALFGSGALVARITTRHPLFGGARQLVLGAAAAAVTYGIGHLVGTAIG